MQNNNPDDFTIDENAQKLIDNATIKDFFQTKVSNGRHIKIALRSDGSVYIKQTSFHIAPMEPNVLNLSPETFSFLLEAMLHAEKQFRIDRRKSLEKIGCENGKVEFIKSFPIG